MQVGFIFFVTIAKSNPKGFREVELSIDPAVLILILRRMIVFVS